MKLRELIDELIELGEEHGDELEIKIAHQPHHPLAHYLKGVVAGREVIDLDKNDSEFWGPEEEEMNKTVWLVACEGNCTPMPYAPKQLWDMI
jgi:hypothetical protein